MDNGKDADDVPESGCEKFGTIPSSASSTASSLPIEMKLRRDSPISVQHQDSDYKEEETPSAKASFPSQLGDCSQNGIVVEVVGEEELRKLQGASRPRFSICVEDLENRELERGRPSMPQLMREHSYEEEDERATVRSEQKQLAVVYQRNPSAVLDKNLDKRSYELGAEEGRLHPFKDSRASLQERATRKEGIAPSGKIEKKGEEPDEPQKMHFFEAVFIPCFTNICGTLLYLRMGYVAGQAGILAGVGVVLFSTFVVGITALSASAICSNGTQLGSGVYYVVSRSLGPQFGGVIGVIFSLANVGMAALYVVGISEFISDLLTEAGYAYVTISREDDIRLFSIVVCLALMLITFAGPKFSRLTTTVFFATYITSYINWLVGTILPVNEEKFLKGVTGYNLATAEQNMLPDFRNGESIVTVFAVFFPGFTGMLASTMFVNQLKNPGQDMAIGLFTSIVGTAVMYVVAVIACGATMLRDADGLTPPRIDNATGEWATPSCAETSSCRYGLMNYYQVAELTSAWRPLIIIGMFGMTTSSAMTNFDQGPQTFQAACKDNIFPCLRVFSKEYGRNKEPRRAYLFLSFVALALTLIGDLNILNRYVTNLFMATYVLVNYACFDASFVRTPGWRPEFAYYNMWASLFGAGLCVVIMFMVAIDSSLVISAIFGGCLAYFHYAHPEVNWGDTNRAHTYRSAHSNLLRLAASEEHVKNYRPQILLLSGNPASRPALIDFVHSITKGDSLLICGHVVTAAATVEDEGQLHTILQSMNEEIECWLRRNKIKAFHQSVADRNFRQGAAYLEQLAGLGKLQPNIVLLGFKQDWWALPESEWPIIEDYVGVLRDALRKGFGLGVLRSPEGWEYSLCTPKYVNKQSWEELEQYAVHVLRLDMAETFLREGVKDIDALKSSAHTSNIAGHLLEHQNHVTTNNNNATALTNVTDTTSMGMSTLNLSRTAGSSVRKVVGSTLKKSLRLPAYMQRIGSRSQLSQSTQQKLNVSKFYSDRHWFEEELGGDTLKSNSSTIQAMKAAQMERFAVSTISTRGERALRRSRSEATGISLHIQEQLEREASTLAMLAQQMNRFNHTHKRARIDVWWLYDDGGLTLLIPHLLRLPKSYLEGAELRVFTLSAGSSNSELDERQMVTLLNKFRIEFKSVRVIEVLKQRLHSETVRDFNKLIKPWRRSNYDDAWLARPNEEEESYTEEATSIDTDLKSQKSRASTCFFITDEEMKVQRKRTHRHLLTRQLLLQHSFDATLVIITLPVPRQGISTCLYMVWLDLLSRDLPPALLIRGNQTSVLTFYS